jgi:nitrite reductase/ring-hydroxylating ferredoxin subunit
MSMAPRWHARALDVLPLQGGERPSVEEALARAHPGEVVAARHGQRPVALALLVDGRAFAVDDACPHDGGPLSDGFVDGDRLVCARHGWELELCTGRCPQRAAFSARARRVR